MGIAHLDKKNACPDARRCEARVREDHQIKVFAHRALPDIDRFAAAGLYTGHNAAMALKEHLKTGAKYPFLRYDQNVVNCRTSN